MPIVLQDESAVNIVNLLIRKVSSALGETLSSEAAVSLGKNMGYLVGVNGRKVGGTYSTAKGKLFAGEDVSQEELDADMDKLESQLMRRAERKALRLMNKQKTPSTEPVEMRPVAVMDIDVEPQEQTAKPSEKTSNDKFVWSDELNDPWTD